MNYNQAKFTAAYGTVEQLPDSRRPEVAFVGRSNVGKSSLLNAIFRRKDLVKVSSTPGKTTTINFFSVGNVNFVDLPGYGFAKTSQSDKKRWQALVDGYFESDRPIAITVSLVDIRHDVSPLDIQMINYLLANQIPFMIVFTKADKLTPTQLDKQVDVLCKQILQQCPGLDDVEVGVLPVSAMKGTGLDKLRSLVEAAIREAQAKPSAAASKAASGAVSNVTSMAAPDASSDEADFSEEV